MLSLHPAAERQGVASTRCTLERASKERGCLSLSGESWALGVSVLQVWTMELMPTGYYYQGCMPTHHILGLFDCW